MKKNYLCTTKLSGTMNLSTLFILIGIILLIVFYLIGRVLYQRSVRIRNQLQMSYIFTNITHELLTPLTIVAASVERFT